MVYRIGSISCPWKLKSPYTSEACCDLQLLYLSDISILMLSSSSNIKKRAYGRTEAFKEVVHYRCCLVTLNAEEYWFSKNS